MNIVIITLESAPKEFELLFGNGNTKNKPDPLKFKDNKKYADRLKDAQKIPMTR